MEVVGGVSALITLIEASCLLAELSTDLVSRWRNAPQELQALATRLSLLNADLQTVQNATATTHPILSETSIRHSLVILLDDARKHLDRLDSLHQHLQKSGNVCQRLQWAVKDASTMEREIRGLRNIEQRLANVMTVMTLKAQTPILEGIGRIEQILSALTSTLSPIDVSRSLLPSPMSTRVHVTQAGACQTGETTVLSRSPWILNKSWSTWGLTGTMLTTKEGPYTGYRINFSLISPLANIFGGYALKVSLALRTTPSCRNVLTFRHPSYFAVARICEENHPFMHACRVGDLMAVRSMLRSGEGRPTDVTAGGQWPLLYAARHGRLDIVAELLSVGVDVDAKIYSRWGTSRTALNVAVKHKHVDIVRLLLQHGASQDHVLDLEHSSAMWCWLSGSDLTKISPLEMFRILNEAACQDMSAKNLDGRTALHIASESGTDSDINALLSLGSVVHSLDIVGYAPINDATFYGNFATYSALVGHYDANSFKDWDSIGWSLLHSTVAGKELHDRKSLRENSCSTAQPREHGKILRDILERGANPRTTVVLPRDWFVQDGWNVPWALRGHQATAQELAAAYGRELEEWYLGILRDCGLLDICQHNQELHDPGVAENCCNRCVPQVGDGTDDDGVEVGTSKGIVGDGYALKQEYGEVDAGINLDEDSTSCRLSETGETEQFWDAEETLEC